MACLIIFLTFSWADLCICQWIKKVVKIPKRNQTNWYIQKKYYFKYQDKKQKFIFDWNIYAYI